MARKLSQEKINEILRLFYEEHKKRIEIHRITGVSRPTINKYIKEDPRYLSEVAYRLLEAKNRRKLQWRSYQQKRRERAKRELWDETYEIMKREHAQAVAELSYHGWPSVSTLYEFVRSCYRWVRGKFIRRDQLDDGTLVPTTLPKYIRPPYTLTEGLKRKRNTVINTANNALAY
ncbi:hypothetical protein Calkr_2177 [Caldicellulosiruptor acetigenus I77R1B]|uniref:Uncharacterized protein n=1 Tax=Caldicellulosiruptor acetigenus (strain ATCC 700853 / DSM 12137 / I77R1B) TaxID=632335 RepID=E4S682_CALA7|nr:hypothetical protein [Caldicellulosiruptor acetigenus]ADQ41640.1 hypothetical protein Calkr_2177 [Caldicellulosiruptor acetigenus I77R1B]